MKRFFLFAAAISGTSLALSATMPAAFAQTPSDAPVPATAPVKMSAEKKKSILALIELMGTVELTRQSIDSEIDAMQAAGSSVPKELWEKMRKRFTERVPDLVEKIIPIYDKYYTKEEIDGLLAFYQTPLGQKIVKSLPAVQKESAAVGAVWGRTIGEEVGREFEKEMRAGAGEKTAPKTPAKSFDKKPFQGNGKPVTTPSGLKYEDMTVGTGATAVKGKTCVMHYTGTLTDGTKFDSSRDRNEPFAFTLGAGNVIPGWEEGVAGMKVGGRRKLTIPAKLGYGEQGTPGGPIPPNATLIFDVELMDIE